MAAIICPNCKSHISDWDLNCLNCGMTITNELRKKLVEEAEKREVREPAEESPHEKALKLHSKFKLQRKLNQMSLRLFKRGFGEIVVPVFVFILFLVVVALILFRDFGFFA